MRYTAWWHEFYDFPYIGHVIIPTDELHHFSEGVGGSTTNQIYTEATKLLKSHGLIFSVQFPQNLFKSWGKIWKNEE